MTSANVPFVSSAFGENIVLPEKAVRPTGLASERVKFIEAKHLDMDLVTELLDECAAVNQWANFGPLYDRLAAEYAAHMSLESTVALTPCANAGVALEMVARTLAAEAEKPKLNWIGSAFSFKNLGRGYFAEMLFLDCDDEGLLDLDALKTVPPDNYDGIIVTNPFGMARNFDQFIRFAELSGKKLIIDNAAGIDRTIPPWPWQVFSLHHTKPYGIGEGGLALSPATAQEFMRLVINYDRLPDKPTYWLNNGKISDIACAFLIARLRNIDDWEKGYLEQRERIHGLFQAAGMISLLSVSTAPVTSNLPVLLGRDIDEKKLTSTTRFADITRQYQPLAPTLRAHRIFSQLINYPTHPDLSRLTDAEVLHDIETLRECHTGL